MSTSLPLRSTLKQNNNYDCASKLSPSTNKSCPTRDSKVSYRNDASIGTHDDFCDISFDVPPGKRIEEVRKVFQLIETTLKLIDEASAITQCYQRLQRSDHA